MAVRGVVNKLTVTNKHAGVSDAIVCTAEEEKVSRAQVLAVNCNCAVHAPYRNAIPEMAGEPDHAYAAGYQFERGDVHFESTSRARKSKQTKPPQHFHPLGERGKSEDTGERVASLTVSM